VSAGGHREEARVQVPTKNVGWWTVAMVCWWGLWGLAVTGVLMERACGRSGPDVRALAALAPGSSAEAPPLDPGETVPPGFALSGPIVCAGSGDVRIERKYIKSDGDGVSVLGSCDVTIVDSVISAKGAAIHLAGSGDVDVRKTAMSGNIGVRILGSGDVDLEGCTVVGRSNAFVLRGSGDVNAESCHVEGGTDARGSGEVVDGGGNTFR
jgi:hypothetical protein